jgi:hypothetical protein
VTGSVLIALSVTALLTVLIGYTQPPYIVDGRADEGTLAHIFQLAIAALVPVLLLFLITMDRKQPVRSIRLLALPATALALAFGALYYLEHYR